MRNTVDLRRIVLHEVYLLLLNVVCAVSHSEVEQVSQSNLHFKTSFWIYSAFLGNEVDVANKF